MKRKIHGATSRHLKKPIFSASMSLNSHKSAFYYTYFRIGHEIEKKRNLFIQLEILARGLLRKDTEKSLTLLTDLFLYYAGFTFKASATNFAGKPKGRQNIGGYCRTNNLT